MRPVQEEDTTDLHGWTLVDFAAEYGGIYAMLFERGKAKVYVSDAADDFYDPRWEAFAPDRGDLERFLSDCNLSHLDLPITPSAVVYCHC